MSGLANDARVKKLEREIKQLEEERDRIADRIELTEVRLNRAKAKGSAGAEEVSQAEKRLEELDTEFDKKDTQLTEKKKLLEDIQSGKVVDEDPALKLKKQQEALALQQQQDQEVAERARREEEERKKQVQRGAAEKLSKAREEATAKEAAEKEAQKKLEEEERRVAQMAASDKISRLMNRTAVEEKAAAEAAKVQAKEQVKTGKAWKQEDGPPAAEQPSHSNLSHSRPRMQRTDSTDPSKAAGDHRHSEESDDKKKKSRFGALSLFGTSSKSKSSKHKDGSSRKKKSKPSSSHHHHRDSPSSQGGEESSTTTTAAAAAVIAKPLDPKTKQRLHSSNLKTSSATLNQFLRARPDGKSQVSSSGLNKTFDIFLDTIGITKPQEREQWHREHTSEVKEKLVRALGGGNLQITTVIQSDDSPAYFVNLLKTNSSDVDGLKRLRLQLEQSQAAWTREFVGLNGVQHVCEAIDVALFAATQSASLPPLKTLKSFSEEEAR